MASNKIPKSPLKVIIALAEDMLDGATTHEAAVGLAQNTAAKLGADLSAVKTKEPAFQVARQAKTNAISALGTADSNGRACIAASKKVLEVTLGGDWSVAWAPAGWPGPTLQIPSTQDARFSLLGSLAAYFTANPAKEVPALGVTAAEATARGDAISAARKAANDKTSLSSTAKGARDAAVDALTSRMSGLVEELGKLIEGDDPLWYAFGLNRPDDSETPETVDEVVLTAGAPGTVLVDWADSRRATRYKVETLLPGATEWTAAATTEDSDATLPGLPTGATVKVRVIAANEAGDAAPSPEATITVP
jgi:hypothetical protein